MLLEISLKKWKKLEAKIVDFQTSIEVTREQNGIKAIKSKKNSSRRPAGWPFFLPKPNKNFDGAPICIILRKRDLTRAPCAFTLKSLCSVSALWQWERADIRQRAVQLYNKLYGSEYREDEAMSAGFYTGLPRVQNMSMAELEKSLCEWELHNTLLNMEGGKAAAIGGSLLILYNFLGDAA